MRQHNLNSVNVELLGALPVASARLCGQRAANVPSRRARFVRGLSCRTVQLSKCEHVLCCAVLCCVRSVRQPEPARDLLRAEPTHQAAHSALSAGGRDALSQSVLTAHCNALTLTLTRILLVYCTKYSTVRVHNLSTTRFYKMHVNAQELCARFIMKDLRNRYALPACRSSYLIVSEPAVFQGFVLS